MTRGDGGDAAPSGAGYLIEAVDQLHDLPRRREYVLFLRRLLIDEADRAHELTPEEETAVGVVLGAVQMAVARDDYEGLMRAIAAGMQVAMRFTAPEPR